MRRKFNPSQARDAMGRWTSGTKVAAVPYARASLRSQTVGVNAGANVSRKFRVSAGGYVRIERRGHIQVEDAIRNTNNKAVRAISKKLAPNEKLEPLVEAGVRKAQNKALRKVLGGQHRLGKDAYARVGTTRSGLPSLIVRKGSHRVGKSKRNAGIDRYNAQLQGVRQARAASKMGRPQRRKKNAA